MPEPGNVTINLFNVAGEKLSVMVNENMPARYHTKNLDLTNYSSGVYFYQFNVNGFSENRKMVLIK